MKQYLPNARGFDEMLIHGTEGSDKPASEISVNEEECYFDNVLCTTRRSKPKDFAPTIFPCGQAKEGQDSEGTLLCLHIP